MCALSEANRRPSGTGAGDEPRAAEEMGQRLRSDMAPAVFLAERRRGRARGTEGPAGVTA